MELLYTKIFLRFVHSSRLVCFAYISLDSVVYLVHANRYCRLRNICIQYKIYWPKIWCVSSLYVILLDTVFGGEAVLLDNRLTFEWWMRSRSRGEERTQARPKRLHIFRSSLACRICQSPTKSKMYRMNQWRLRLLLSFQIGQRILYEYRFSKRWIHKSRAQVFIDLISPLSTVCNRLRTTKSISIRSVCPFNGRYDR